MEMSTVRMALIGLVGLFLAACGGEDKPQSPERVDGKTRSEWETALGSEQPKETVTALRALARFDEPPIPLFEARLEHADPQVRAAAILCLGVAGPEAAKWAPDLATYLEEDPEGMDPKACRAIRNAAMNTLGKIGPAAFPHIAHLLASREVKHRQYAAFAIRPFVAELENGTKVLLPLVEDENAFVRVQAVRGLGEAGKGDDRAADALLTAIEDEDPNVVRYAALALGGIGGRSDVEGEALAKLLVRHEGGIRAAAVHGLGEMADEAAPYADDVLDLLKNDAKRAVRIQAALAHYRITGETGEALPEIEKSIPCQDPGLCRDALRAIQAFGPAAAATVPKIVPLLDNPQLRRLAVAALGAVGPEAKEAVPALERVAKSANDAELTEEIEAALDAIGPAG